MRIDFIPTMLRRRAPASSLREDTEQAAILVVGLTDAMRRRTRLRLTKRGPELSQASAKLRGVKRMHRVPEQPASGRTSHGAATMRRRHRAAQIARATRQAQRAQRGVAKRLRQRRRGRKA